MSTIGREARNTLNTFARSYIMRLSLLRLHR